MGDNNFQVLQTKDLMNYLRIGKDRAYALMRSKSFPSMRIGKTYCVTMTSLQAWLNENAGKNVNL